MTRHNKCSFFSLVTIFLPFWLFRSTLASAFLVVFFFGVMTGAWSTSPPSISCSRTDGLLVLSLRSEPSSALFASLRSWLPFLLAFNDFRWGNFWGLVFSRVWFLWAIFFGEKHKGLFKFSLLSLSVLLLDLFLFCVVFPFLLLLGNVSLFSLPETACPFSFFYKATKIKTDCTLFLSTLGDLPLTPKNL